MNQVFSALKRNKTIYKVWIPVKYHIRKIRYSRYANYPGLNGKLSYKDAMFIGDINHYMKVGSSAIENIENVLAAANKSFDSLKAVLDIPSGHGRVFRLLATKVPPDKLTACDLDEDGIEFCEREFGSKKFLSSRDLSTIHFPEKYSLIWVGSLFTHLDQEPFSNLLKVLFESLEPDGVLVFTTHGRYSVEIFDRYWAMQPIPVPASREQLQEELEKNKGFYYAPYYNSEDYGVTISLKQYVLSLLDRLFKGNAKLLLYKERGWDNHQDVFAIQKVVSMGQSS